MFQIDIFLVKLSTASDLAFWVESLLIYIYIYIYIYIITLRIAQRKISFHRMKSVLRNKYISIQRRKRALEMLDGLRPWLNAGRVTDALIATMDRNAWKVMIAAYAKELGPAPD